MGLSLYVRRGSSQDGRLDWYITGEGEESVRSGVLFGIGPKVGKEESAKELAGAQFSIAGAAKGTETPAQAEDWTDWIRAKAGFDPVILV
jgi:hypothetical protein